MNTTQALARIRQIAQLKNEGAEPDWNSAEILTEMYQALVERFSQPIESCRQGYWLHRVTTTTIANQQTYQLPVRAIVGGLEKLEISSDGGRAYRQLPILTDSQATDYTALGASEPYAFSLESDRIVLWPTPSTGSYTLRFSYYIRPSILTVAVADGFVASKTTTTVTLVAPFSGMPTSGTIDCIHTSGSYELSLVDAPYTRSGNVMTFPATVDLSRVAVDDVMRPVETSDYLPLPQELHRPLVDYTAAVILAAKGDFEKANIWSKKSERAIAAFVDLATPRIKDRPYTFRTKNTFLRRRLSTRRW